MFEDYHEKIKDVVNKHNAEYEGSLLEEHAHLVADLTNKGREEQIEEVKETIEKCTKDSKFSKRVSIISIGIAIGSLLVAIASLLLQARQLMI